MFKTYILKEQWFFNHSNKIVLYKNPDSFIIFFTMIKLSYTLGCTEFGQTRLKFAVGRDCM